MCWGVGVGWDVTESLGIYLRPPNSMSLVTCVQAPFSCLSQKKHTLQSTLRSKDLQCGKCSRFEGKRDGWTNSKVCRREDGAWFPATSAEDLRPGDHYVKKKKKKNLLNAICLGTEMQVLARTSAARAAHSDLGTCRHL